MGKEDNSYTISLMSPFSHVFYKVNLLKD